MKGTLNVSSAAGPDRLKKAVLMRVHACLGADSWVYERRRLSDRFGSPLVASKARGHRAVRSCFPRAPAEPAREGQAARDEALG